MKDLIVFKNTLLLPCDLSGAYHSTDRGKTWECIGADRGMDETHVSCFGFHQSNPDIFFIGTGDGIFRTTDGGTSFTRVITDGYIEVMVFSAGTPQVGYAGRHSKWNVSDGHIYRTANSGAAWQQVSGNLPTGLRILKLQLAKGSKDTLYVLTGNGRFSGGPKNVYVTKDGGTTWSAIGNDFNQLVMDIAADKHDPATVWASVDDTTSDLGTLYKSTDCGKNWTYICNRGGYIWLDADNPQCIRSIELRITYPWRSVNGVWESNSGGQTGTWTRVSKTETWERGWSSIHWATNGRLYGAAEVPGYPGRLYWCSSQFVHGTMDSGRTVHQFYTNEIGGNGIGRWQWRGIDNINMMDLAVSEADPDRIWMGSPGTGIHMRDLGVTAITAKHFHTRILPAARDRGARLYNLSGQPVPAGQGFTPGIYLQITGPAGIRKWVILK